MLVRTRPTTYYPQRYLCLLFDLFGIVSSLYNYSSVMQLEIKSQLWGVIVNWHLFHNGIHVSRELGSMLLTTAP